MTNEERAIKMMKACEAAGKIVRKVIVEGKKVEVEFTSPKVEATGPDEVKW